MQQAIADLFRLFTPDQRRTSMVLVVAMMGGMLLETLSIGAVAPVMLVLSRGEFSERWPWAARHMADFGIKDDPSLVMAGMGLIVLLFGVKCVYVSWLTARQMRFVYRVQADISRRLFASYLAKPWTFHLQHNSAELIRNVVTATNELTLTGLVSLLILATEICVLVGIGSLLLWLEPAGTIGAAVLLGSLGIAFNTTTRQGIRRASEARQVHETMRIRTLQQALGGLKELTVLGRRQNALDQYVPHNFASANIGRRQATLQALPKLWLEMLAVLGMAVLVLSLLWQDRPQDVLVATIAVFAAAAFRLIPSMNRILGSMQFIRYSIPTINILRRELLDAGMPNDPFAEAMGLRDAITLESVSLRYAATDRAVLTGINLKIDAGTTIGIIGGSGAGKSTLVEALLGLLPPESGTIRADGRDISGDIYGWRKSIGYVPQSIYLIDDTLRRNIAFGLDDCDIDELAVARAIAAAQLSSFVENLPEGLDTITGERGIRLSGGERQRIGIARALYHDPSVLLLDEATSALDHQTESGVMDAINALHGSKTIVMITHRPSTLRYCDHVYQIADGSIVAAAPQGR